MAKINIGKRAEEVMAKLPEFLRCIEADIRPEAKEDWRADYAIFLVDVMEPEDGVREYFDVGLLFTEMHDFIAKQFSKKAVKLNGFATKDPAPGTLLVRKHGLYGGGWSREFEIYRTKPKKVAAKSKKAAKKEKKL